MSNFKENLEKVCKSVMDEVKEELEKSKEYAKTPGEKLRDALNKNPSMSEEEIRKFLDDNTQDPQKVSEKVRMELGKFIKSCEDFLDSEEIKELQNKYLELLKDRDVEKMRSVLKMTSSLEDIVSTTKECTASIRSRVIKKFKEL